MGMSSAHRAAGGLSRDTTLEMMMQYFRKYGANAEAQQL